MSKRLNIIIEKDEFGYYAYCPDLDGCRTQGETLDEVTENIKEAIELVLEVQREELHRKSPAGREISQIEVADFA